MDFVNQSVLQISSQDVEGKRSDKTDFAEKLGAMNRRWQILQGLITEKVASSPPSGLEGDSVFTQYPQMLLFLPQVFTGSSVCVCVLPRSSRWRVCWRAGWSMRMECRP